MKLAKTAQVIRRAVVPFLASIGLICVLVTITPVTSLWAARLAAPWSMDRGDVLIILAGDKLDDGVAGLNSYWRCFYGALAWRLGGFSHVLITGDNVVEPMRQLLIVMGVPAPAIQLEAQSASTHESAIHIQPILLSMTGKKVLLTSDYHMFRARRTFQKAGIVTGFWTVPDITKRSVHFRGRWPAFLDLLDESSKIVYYFVRGW